MCYCLLVRSKKESPVLPARTQSTTLRKLSQDTLAPTRSQGSGARIVTLDIETAPLESYHWGLWDQNIGLEQIGTDWSILSFSAKWLGEEPIIYMDTGGHGAKHVRDDAKLLKALWEILDTADIVVTQNGRAFDIKKINARLLQGGFKPYSPIHVVDTKLVAQRRFALTSNKLAWMSEHLTTTKKQSHKAFPGFELWKECLRDNPKAWQEMKQYNIADTIATEELYLKLLPWIDNHPNRAVYTEAEAFACPKCGSEKVQKRGTYRTNVGAYHRYQCQDCGGWSRSRHTTLPKTKRQNLLVSQ